MDYEGRSVLERENRRESRRENRRENSNYSELIELNNDSIHSE